MPESPSPAHMGQWEQNDWLPPRNAFVDAQNELFLLVSHLVNASYAQLYIYNYIYGIPMNIHYYIT